jgi:cellulose synthase/poly-beta-1,6-N-acetylglucosamine synthase-like glycosyltransferase
MLLTLIIALYVICALMLTFHTVGEIILLFVYWKHRHPIAPPPPVTVWPIVTVQLPMYNERYVVKRLLEAVAALDYPRDRLTVQVLDDSVDETTVLVAAQVEALRRMGLNIQHIHRKDRTGYKAGALANGLSLTDSELIVILDADFVPSPDFLRKTVPYLVADLELGMIQTRWGHLNPFDNLLTRGQTLALDGHFVVEQTARNRAGWLMNFNGSGGVWRAQCIREAGGWRDTTLTEDLDLSYRAQLKGWRFLYLPQVVVPGELPPHMAAYKQQQARWAKGSTQCLIAHLVPVWRQPGLTFFQKLMATHHLCQYLPHPLTVIILLLTPLLLLTRSLEHLPLSLLGLVGLWPPLMYVASQRALYPDWQRRLLAFPMLMAMGIGIAWNNTRAVVSGAMGKRGEFLRTPKFGQAGHSAGYALVGDSSLWIEIFLSLYALWGVTVALKKMPTLAPYLMLYSLAFAGVALWSIRDRLQLKHRAAAHTNAAAPL